MYSAILFDFDGTLVDSSKSIFDEYVRVAELMGLRGITYQEFAAQLGKPWDEALQGLWPGVDKKEFTGNYRRELEKTPVLPGVVEVLNELRESYALGLLTSRGQKSLHTILCAAGISEGVFSGVFSKESISKHKPDPAALVEASEKMGLSLAGIVYVGDSVVDAECAKDAGVFFIGVLSGGTVEADFKALGVEYVIDSVAKLPRLLVELEDAD